MLSPALHARALAHAKHLTTDHSEAVLVPLVDAYETGYAWGLAEQPQPTPDPKRLDLYALHARLLPLAQAAGHEQLLLTEHVGQLDGTTAYYEADCAGGRSGFRRYIDYFGHESAAEHFERELRKKLAQQQDYLLNSLSHAA